MIFENSFYNLRKSYDDSVEDFILRIPRDYARGNTTTRPTYKKICEVPHYELHITHQVGSSYTRKPTYVYWTLPKSKRLVAIVLHPDGGVEFKKDEHKFIIRETDELDRRIILGFCKKHQSSLTDACHDFERGEDYYWDLVARASIYKASDMPKRIKTGKGSSDLTWFYKNSLEPYEECGIFDEVHFIA